jgi:hypothetical protein
MIQDLVDDRLILDTGDYLGFTSALLAMIPQLFSGNGFRQMGIVEGYILYYVLNQKYQ